MSLNITLKELRERLDYIVRKYEINDEKEFVIDSWVAGNNDKDYPEGTLILQCETATLNKIKTPEDVHMLEIYPRAHISRLN